MNKKLLLAGFWTMSMALVCQGAEAEKTYQQLASERTAINENLLYHPMTQLTKLGQLEKEVEVSKQYNTKVKERRALGVLQQRLKKDQELVLKKATA
jgi:hypothetical protein